MATLADDFVSLISTYYGDTGEGGTTPAQIKNLGDIKRGTPFPSGTESVLIYLPRPARYIILNDRFCDVDHEFKVRISTPSSDTRLKEISDEVRRIVYSNTITGVHHQEVSEENEVTDRRDPIYRIDFTVRMLRQMVSRGVAYDGGVAGSAFLDKPFVTYDADADLTSERLLQLSANDTMGATFTAQALAVKTDSTYDIGADATRFKKAYLDDIDATEGTIDELRSLSIPATYIVYVSGGTTYAISQTGGTDYSNATADVAIQAAIDACTAGGMIFIKAGDYNITSSLIISGDSKIRLTGEGTKSKLYTTADNGIITITNSNDIEIDHLYFLGSDNAAHTSQTAIAITATSTNIHIHHCKIEEMGYDAIYALVTTTGLTITNNYVKDCNDDGINPGGGAGTGTERTIVANNYVTGCTGDGIHLSDTLFLTSVVGNIVEGCGAGIGLFDCEHVSITGNILQGNTYGIQSKQTAPRYITITGNIIRDSTTDGILLAYSEEDIIISNNYIEDSGGRGINVQNGTRIVIANNIINDTTSDGILIVTDDFVIIGNSIYNTGNHGIAVSGAGSGGDGIVSNNYIDTVTTYYGVNVYAAGVHVIGNMFVNITGANAINLTAEADNCLVMHNDVTGKTIANAGSGNRIEQNFGFVTENGGTATILSGNATIVVTHGLKTTPTYVVVTGQHEETRDLIVSAVAAANFTVSTGDAAVTTANRDVYWRAVYVP